MDLNRIIQELIEERDRIQAIIESLEKIDGGTLTASAGRPSGTAGRRRDSRGRKFMGEAERQQVAARMRAYWARRREQSGSGSSQARATAAAG